MTKQSVLIKQDVLISTGCPTLGVLLLLLLVVVVTIPYLFSPAVMMYKGLVQGYEFDESSVQPLIIPGMEAPPPIPPKKRRRKRVAATDKAANPSDPTQPQKQDTLSRRSTYVFSAHIINFNYDLSPFV